MFRSIMERRLKAAAALLCILALLPYIVTVFVNGTEEIDGNEIYVRASKSMQNGKSETVTISWTEYMVGILAEQVPEDFEQEAAKAQAVLIRTQLYRTYCDLEDKVLKEQYLTLKEMERKWGSEKLPWIYENLVRAVTETDDCVLLYQNAYAWTPYHYSSNGRTRSAKEVMNTDEFPYIVMKECPADKEADGEITSVTYSYAEIQKRCRDFLVAVSDGEQAEKGYVYEDFEICEKDESGYVSRLRIGNTYCSGDQFRDAMGLASSAFEFSQAETESENPGGEGGLKITVTGNGHGLGMSLWTANVMAKEGMTWEEILSFFFGGTQINREEDEGTIF